MPEPNPYFANLQRGSALLNANRPRDALSYFQAAIAANPDNPTGYAELARCYIELPGQQGKSIGAIDRAIALAPNTSYYFGLKGWFLVCLVQYRRAFDAAQQGLAINPICGQSLNALANAHTKLGQWKKAELACLRILELNPNDAPGLNLLAQALRHQGRWKDARAVVERILAQMPNNAFGHANAGYAALAAGDHLRANEHFLESLRLNPHFDLARRGLLQSLRARNWVLRFNARVAAAFQGLAGDRNRMMNLFFLGGAVVSFGVWLVFRVLSQLNLLAAQLIGSILIVGVMLYLCLSVAVALIGNFLLMFDPMGRHALTVHEKIMGCIPIIPLVLFLTGLIAAGAWIAALILVIFLFLLALSIQYPLLKDRYLRHRQKAAE